LFVIMLVVLSLLLSAGTVVFVNQVANANANLKIAQDTLANREEAVKRLTAEVETAHADARTQVDAAERRVASMQQELNAANQNLVTAATELAQAKNQAQIQSVSVTTLTGALQGAQNTISTQQNQISELRGSNDKLATQNEQLNLTVTDLTNRLDVTERERRLLQEQLAEARGQAEKQGAMLRDMGVSPAQLASAGTRLSAPSISGVIRDVRSINGIPYATISVGAADNVAKGMEFKVISHDTNKFLGVLKVDMVEQNEATGRLEGPDVAQVKKGADVKTQLQ
jgi:hypothetical protein